MNSGKLGKFQENSGELSGVFCMALNMNSVGIPGGFRGNAIWGFGAVQIPPKMCIPASFS